MKVGTCYRSVTSVVGNLSVEKEGSEGSVISSGGTIKSCRFVVCSVILSHVSLRLSCTHHNTYVCIYV